MHTIAIIFMLAFLAAPASAQHGHEGGAGAATELHPGLGSYHHEIATKNPQAQQYFDQGLTLLYGFNHAEAARYFRRAAELDPDAAMPYWGLALSLGPNYNDTAVDADRAKKTYEAVRMAAERARKGPAIERDYIRALQKRYPTSEPKSDWKKYHLDYSNAMRELTKKYPDDLDAATMFAESLMMLRPWQLWSLDGKPAPGTLELVSVLESVLKRNPNHPGANHFYIHAVEASPNLERAIPSAERLTKLVPGAGHLVHMPGHIYLQTGDYDLAAKTNENAAKADQEFVQRTGATGIYPLMYWTHNIHFIAYARTQQGRYEDAKKAAGDIVKNVGDADQQMQMLEGFLTYPEMVDLAFHRWDDILAAPEPKRERELQSAFHHYARAMAYAARGQVKEAEAERKQFEKLRAAVPADSVYLINNKASDFLTLAAATLDAQLQWARGDKKNSVASWRRAVDLESKLHYDEPPPWIYPVRQPLGAALLRSGDAKGAEAVFRQALQKHPRDGRLLFGLQQSLLAQGRKEEASLVEARYKESWKDATAKLTVADL